MRLRRPSWPDLNIRAWLRPGVGIKRWLGVVFIGELGLALALALLLRQVYRDVVVDGPLQALLYVVTLQFLPYVARGTILATAGTALFAYGSMKVIRVLMDPFHRTDAQTPLVEVIYQKRFLARGPRIVAIGGGTGLSTLLRGLKEHSSNLTAVVTVADDGGSSGKLREQLGVPAVGDIRNCIVALADAEPLMGRLLQYRFPADEVPESLAKKLIGAYKHVKLASSVVPSAGKSEDLAKENADLKAQVADLQGRLREFLDAGSKKDLDALQDKHADAVPEEKA